MKPVTKEDDKSISRRAPKPLALNLRRLTYRI